jgi:hypothetical protein
VERMNQNVGAGKEAHGGWIGLPIAWPCVGEGGFTPALIRRNGRSAQVLLNPIEVSWLTILPSAGAIAGMTRSLNFTADAKQE